MIDAKIIIFFEFRPHIQPSSQKFLPIASPLFYLNKKISQVPIGSRPLWTPGRANKRTIHNPILIAKGRFFCNQIANNPLIVRIIIKFFESQKLKNKFSPNRHLIH